MEQLSENGKIFVGILQDAQVQDILLSQPLIEIMCKHLGISDEELQIAKSLLQQFRANVSNA